MSIRDTIKNSVLEKFQTGNLSTISIAVTLGMAIALGLFVYFVYRLNSRSGFYNRELNKSLATMPVITAAIMIAMSSNLAISLGMVGALSIVRFRNAVKNPVDLTFLFWSISIGIVTGAGLFELSVILSLAVAVLLSVLDMIPVLRAPCLLVVAAEKSEAENELLGCAKQFAKTIKIRSRNVNQKGVEWIFELQVRQEEALVKKMAEIEGVSSVHLMTHDGYIRF